MNVGSRTAPLPVALQGLPSIRRRGAFPSGPLSPAVRPPTGIQPPRAMHQPLSADDEAPMDRVERYFADRGEKDSVADLVRLVRDHRDRPAFRALTWWMMQAETSFEFIMDEEQGADEAMHAVHVARAVGGAVGNEATDTLKAQTAQAFRGANLGAIGVVHGFREHIKVALAYCDDPGTVDDADARELLVLEEALLKADAALEQREHALQMQNRQVPPPRLPQRPAAGPLGGVRTWLKRHVDRRNVPPPLNYEPLKFMQQSAEQKSADEQDPDKDDQP